MGIREDVNADRRWARARGMACGLLVALASGAGCEQMKDNNKEHWDSRSHARAEADGGTATTRAALVAAR